VRVRVRQGASSSAACVGLWISGARYSVQHGVGARTYAFQPISSSVPNPSVSGPRMHYYAIRAAGAGAKVLQVAPGLLTVRTPVMATGMRLLEGLRWLLLLPHQRLCRSRCRARCLGRRRADE
jgi:hypothetical protein